MSSSVHTLFIYGTLMPGLRLAHEMAGAVSLGPAQVPGRLVDVGRYPGLVHGPGAVHGELYRVPEALLARLDEVEEMVPGDRAASQYWREPVTVLAGALAGQAVWTYVYNRPTEGLVAIAHGDYRRYIREVGRASLSDGLSVAGASGERGLNAPQSWISSSPRSECG